MLAHIDTVHPIGTLQRMPWKEEGGHLFGPGIYDMKGGLALGLYAIDVLHANHRLPDRQISLLCTSDEELGSDSSRTLIEELARKHKLVLCLEPALPDGSLKTWRKGIADFEVTTEGRATHAGADPSNGINAIIEMTHQIQYLMSLADDAAGTTVNIGTIQGGTRSNVVPERCRAVVDIRVLHQEELGRIERSLHELSPFLEGASVTFTGGWNRPPMPRSPQIEGAFLRAKDIAKQLGIELSEGGTGGGSDANFVAPLGIPLLDGLGVTGGGAHSAQEYVVMDDLPKRAALLAAILSEW